MNKLAVPIALIFVGLGTLMAVAISEGGIPELQVREVVGKDWGTREIKVHGLLRSVESGQRPLRFTVKDKDTPTAEMVVTADQNKPDTFQADYDVAVQGRWDLKAGVFHADKIFTKCPSKYEADEKAGVGSKKAQEQKLSAPKPKDEGTAPAIGTGTETTTATGAAK